MPADVVAFARDWSDTPTSNHHVLRELAKTRRVLWLNSVATRTPELSSGRDLGRILRKLAEFVRGPRNVENDLWVFTPLVLPLPHNAVARWVNRWVLRATVGALRARLGLRDFQLWTFLPNVGDYVGALGESLAVYYCTDEWSMFSYIDTERMVESERALLARVDCVFAVNEVLARSKRDLNPETHLAPHGVHQPLFARALDPDTGVPDDLATLPRPVIGFGGTLQTWVDIDLIVEIARRRPEWSIALIGRVLVDPQPLARLPNVHLLGPRPYEDLPGYYKGFGAGIIPYRTSQQVPYCSPLKLREYLSAGLPVVSTTVPEVERYGRWCSISADADGFVRALEAALEADSPELRSKRSRAMQGEGWDVRVAGVAEIAERLARRRGDQALAAARA
jgi:glycosyltransferase involved in cell wall biosynthesis